MHLLSINIWRSIWGFITYSYRRYSVDVIYVTHVAEPCFRHDQKCISSDFFQLLTILQALRKHFRANEGQAVEIRNLKAIAHAP